MGKEIKSTKFKKKEASSVSASSGTGGLSASQHIVDAARISVAQSKAGSDLYSNLFHKEQKPSGRDLFMSIAGIRYTL